MSQELYYTAPPQQTFDDMKKCCLAVWDSFDDAHGYYGNQQTVLASVQPATAVEFHKRMS